MFQANRPIRMAMLVIISLSLTGPACEIAAVEPLTTINGSQFHELDPSQIVAAAAVVTQQAQNFPASGPAVPVP